MITKPRWAKTNDERFDDTIDYIDDKLTGVDAREVGTKIGTLSGTQKSTLASNLSLGATGKQSDRRTNQQARRAKRALMLVTSLFLNDLNAQAQEIKRVKALSESSEADLIAELKSWFTVPGVTAADVADTAVANMDKMPNWQNVNVPPDLTVRGKYSKGRDYEFNCYNAVVYWAFQAGVISRRYLWNKLYGKDGNTFFPTFSECGWTTVVEYDLGQNPPKLLKDIAPGKDLIIDKGMAVYYVTPHKKFGHVAMSLGNGKVISQNVVLPARKENVKPEDNVAVSQMQQAVTHIINIRHFADIHYFPENGYPKIQHTTRAFWDPIPQAER